MNFGRLTLHSSLLLLCLAGSSGCKESSSVQTPPPNKELTENTDATDDHLATAKRLLKIQDFQAASKAASKALVQDPQNPEVAITAAQIEAALGNHQSAIDLVSSIDVQSRLGKKSILLHAEQLTKLDKRNEAADVIVAGIGSHATDIELRRQAWQLLNHCGRREEASQQADVLCQQGSLSFPELLSLVSRNLSFPRTLKPNQQPEKLFDSKLGMARWKFSEQEFDQAIEVLLPQYESKFESPAACALYGRLLAEMQSFEQFPAWHTKCDDATKQLADYWAALGSYFLDQREFEASARALLEAIYRNPTDRVCVQRLSKVFEALERSDDAAQFQYRGIELANCEQAAKRLALSPREGPLLLQLSRRMITLGRPFETLQWTLAMTPPSDGARRNAIQQQRLQLLRSKDAFVMASESSIIELDRSKFEIQPAIDSFLQDNASEFIPKTLAVKVLATPRLVNVAHEVGLDFQWYQDKEMNLASIPIHESIGGGIAILDFDLDGWPDIYLAQGSGEPPSNECTRPSLLFRNIEGTFRIAAASQTDDFNYSSGLSAGDVNQDGFVDLWMGSLGHNRLLINNGDGTFTDRTASLGQFPDRFSTSMAIADITGDGLPDLFEANYIEMEGAFALPKVGSDGKESLPSPLLHYADSDRWFENLADGTFRLHQIDPEVGKPGTSLGIIITDFDDDGLNEVFVGNDVRPNHLLVQQGNQQFQNLASVKGVANGFSGAPNGCMGIAAGDFNRDGQIDLHITNFYDESANLYLQTSAAGFSDFAVRYGINAVSLPYVGFGTKAIDVDRNGWLDLAVTNGHIFDMTHANQEYQMAPQMLMRTGSQFELVDVEDDSGYWGKTYLGRAMASLDFNRDGASDLLVGHLDQPVALLKNETDTPGQWLQIELVGTTTERDAIGTRVVVTAGQERFTQWVTAGDGYFCSDEPVIDFGIANHTIADEIVVHWPSGNKQSFRDIPTGKRYLIIEGDETINER
ncbi:MAG: FG-GAP-like repeat-containing protein [Rubripirellula sp.]